MDRLIVRRGQPFKLTLNLTPSLVPTLGPLSITATTGKSLIHLTQADAGVSLAGGWEKTVTSPNECMNASLPSTGEQPSEGQGTLSVFSIPEDPTLRSASAKAVWKAELHWSSSTLTGRVCLIITPPADAPIGQYTLQAKYNHEESVLAGLVLLFNTWCPGTE